MILDGPLDPDVMLAALLEHSAESAVGERARQISKLLADNDLAGDANTFVALALVLAGADTVSVCPLGPDRLGALVAGVRELLAEARKYQAAT